MKVIFGIIGICLMFVFGLWATCPQDKSLPRHVLSVLGESVLAGFNFACKVVASILLIGLILWTGWAYINPRLHQAVDSLNPVSSSKKSVTSNTDAVKSFFQDMQQRMNKPKG